MAVRGQPDYRDAVLGARLRSLALTRIQQDQLLAQLRTLADSLERELSGLDRGRVVERLRIRGVLSDMTNLIEVRTRAGIELAARDLATIQGLASERLLEANGAEIAGVTATFEQIGLRSAQALLSRADLSETFKTLKVGVNRDVDFLLSNAALRGQTAAQLERTMRFYVEGADAIPEELLGDRRLIGKRALAELGWEDPTSADVEQMRRLAGTVSSKAMLISRHEMVNAGHESAAENAAQSPIVKAIAWRLSSRHPKADGCDILADEDLYGLGAGIYPKDAIPALLHPRCLCFFEHVLIDPKDIGKPVPAGKLNGKRLEQRMKKAKLTPSARRETRTSIGAGEARRIAGELVSAGVNPTEAGAVRRLTAAVAAGGVRMVGKAALIRITMAAGGRVIGPGVAFAGVRIGTHYIPDDVRPFVKLPPSAFPALARASLDDNIDEVTNWLSRQGFEHYVVVDLKTGHLRMAVQGSAAEVVIPRAVTKLNIIRGQRGFHNHPVHYGTGDWGFSIGDIASFHRNGAFIEGVTTRNYLYEMQARTSAGFRLIDYKRHPKKFTSVFLSPNGDLHPRLATAKARETIQGWQALRAIQKEVEDEMRRTFRRASKFSVQSGTVRLFFENNPELARLTLGLFADETGLQDFRKLFPLSLVDKEVGGPLTVQFIPLTGHQWEEVLRHRTMARFAKEQGYKYTRTLRRIVGTPVGEFTELPMAVADWIAQGERFFEPMDMLGAPVIARLKKLFGSDTPTISLGPFLDDLQLELWEDAFPRGPRPPDFDFFDTKALAEIVTRQVVEGLVEQQAFGAATAAAIRRDIEFFERGFAWRLSGALEGINRARVAENLTDNLLEKLRALALEGDFIPEAVTDAIEAVFQVGFEVGDFSTRLIDDTVARLFGVRIATASPGQIAAAHQTIKLERFVQQLIVNIDQDSAATPWQAFIQHMANEEFGLRGAELMHFEHFDFDIERLLEGIGDDWGEAVADQVEELTRLSLRTMYETTQEALADAPNMIPLFRGWSLDVGEDFDILDLEDWLMQFGRAGEGMVGGAWLQPISSYSTSPFIAAHFAERRTTGAQMFNISFVPKERILSIPTTGFGVLREAETLVLGGELNSIQFRFTSTHIELGLPEPPQVVSWLRILRELHENGLISDEWIQEYFSLFEEGNYTDIASLPDDF